MDLSIVSMKHQKIMKNQIKQKIVTILADHSVDMRLFDIEEAYKLKIHRQQAQSIVVVKSIEILRGVERRGN